MDLSGVKRGDIVGELNRIITNFKPVCPFQFLNYFEMLDIIGNNDDALRELLMINDSVEINSFKEIYNQSFENYKKIVTSELNRVVKEYMGSCSVSLGEAMSFAEKHFEEEIGFLHFFIECLVLSLQCSEIYDLFLKNSHVNNLRGD